MEWICFCIELCHSLIHGRHVPICVYNNDVQTKKLGDHSYYGGNCFDSKKDKFPNIILI